MKSGPFLLLFPLLLSACMQGSTHTGDMARKLNDSAVNLTMRSQDSQTFARAIALLDQANQLDSSYFMAWWNKLAFQGQNRQWKAALKTAEQLRRLKPEDPDILVLTGRLHDRNGDSATAMHHYRQALVRYNRILDTLSRQHKQHDMVQMNKGICLILSGREAEGNGLLQQLYDSHTDEAFREMLSMFLNKTREQLLKDFSLH